MKANSMTSRKTYRHLKGHISTAYKDNKIYTMYTMLKKKNNQITKEMCCTLIKIQK